MSSKLLSVAGALVSATLTAAILGAPAHAAGPTRRAAQDQVAAGSPEASGGRARFVPLGLDLYMPIPEGNRMSDAKVALGRRLFFDSILSDDGRLSCSGCHDPELAFTDGKPVAEGVYGRHGRRNAPTLVNRGYGSSFFFDGRAATLEEQVLVPIEGEDELATRVDDAVVRLRADSSYVGEFRGAFGTDPDRESLAAALASYVRTIVSGNAPIDRFRSGAANALTDLQKEGMRIFRGKGNCTACHVGPSFTDEDFHNTGVAWRPADAEVGVDRPAEGGGGTAGSSSPPDRVAGGIVAGPREAPLDRGRYAVTGAEADLGAFKTPTLREIARTAPYMHDGSLATLADVIDFYDGGGHPNPHLDRQIRPLRLTSQEKAALLAFLQALSGETTEGAR